MTREARQDSRPEQSETFTACCENAAEKMARCGPMMEEMMTRCGPAMQKMMAGFGTKSGGRGTSGESDGRRGKPDEPAAE